VPVAGTILRQQRCIGNDTNRTRLEEPFHEQDPTIDPATAQPPAAELLATIQQSIGATPNMIRAMANSPALLNGYLQLSAALSAACCRRRPGSASP
jgi:hypothetical protein